MKVDGGVTVDARAKAFSGDKVRMHRFLVVGDRKVLVWDDVAGYFTSCHSLTPKAIKRICSLTGRP